MARNRNDDLPLAPQNQAHEGHGTQQAGNGYDVQNLPGMFGELIGRRIGDTLDGSRYFGNLVKYARADEFQVEILVQRFFTDPNYNPDIQLRTSAVAVMTMRYQGRTDGIDRFVLRDLQSRTWTVGLNQHGEVIRQKDQCPNYDIGIFGISEGALRNDYGKFFRLGDAELVEGKAGSPKHEEQAWWDRLAVGCECR